MKEEDGYSLVESLIAMAILLAVLVPSSMFLIYIGNNIYAKEKMEAFNLARNRMELSLATLNDSTITTFVDSKWWVKQRVEKDGDLRSFNVKVFKADTLNPPLIDLKTARLWHE